MRIAIFHNFLENIGGAERVCLTLAKELGADIYSTNIDYGKIKKMGFPDIKIKSIGKVALNAPFRQQSAMHKFRKLNLGNKYDLYIIAGDWAVSGSVHNKPNIWYAHSPIREIWDLYKYTRNNTVPWFFRPVYDVWVLLNRFLNKKYVSSIDKILCNSNNTKNRIKKYLGREATVVFPPIETKKFQYKKNGDYWLSVNRLITHKRVDMQMKAFSKLPEEKLVVVGSYEQAKHFRAHASYIRKLKPDNVKIKSWTSFDELSELYANCKGFISTSKNEDFGMTVVEAMASGKPVIAPNEGGYREIILDNVTGKLINNINEEKLRLTIKEISKNPNKYRVACMKQAKKFDTEVFIKRIKEEIHF